MIDGVKVFDIHEHIALPTTGTWGLVAYTPEKLLGRMQESGIDVAAICHLPSGLLSSEDFRRANDYVLEAAQKYEAFIAFCELNPLHGGFAIDELHRCHAAGAKGVKFWPAGHGDYYLDSPVMDEIMKEIEKLGMLVLTHSDFHSFSYTPYQVVRLAKRFPNVYIVMAHFGNSSELCWFVPSIVAETPNVLLDTACVPPVPEAIFVRPVKEIGPERLVFGSDLPDIDAIIILKMLELAEQRFNLDKETKRIILGKNIACKVLGIKQDTDEQK